MVEASLGGGRTGQLETLGEVRGKQERRLPLLHSFLATSRITVEPLNKGHFGANSFVPCREVVPISEVK